MTTLKIEGFEQAVEDFNAWIGNARIYFNTHTDEMWTEVFANDVSAVGTFNNNDSVVTIYSKVEANTLNRLIGNSRKQGLIKICGWLKEGWFIDQIEYNFAEELYELGM